jgi:hypothetical protein
MVPMMETDQDVVMSPVVSSTNTSVHKTQEKTENEDKKRLYLKEPKTVWTEDQCSGIQTVMRSEVATQSLFSNIETDLSIGVRKILRKVQKHSKTSNNSQKKGLMYYTVGLIMLSNKATKKSKKHPITIIYN